MTLTETEKIVYEFQIVPWMNPVLALGYTWDNVDELAESITENVTVPECDADQFDATKVAEFIVSVAPKVLAINKYFS